MERAQLACVRVGKGGTKKLSHEMRTTSWRTVRDPNEQEGKRAFIQEGKNPVICFRFCDPSRQLS